MVFILFIFAGVSVGVVRLGRRMPLPKPLDHTVSGDVRVHSCKLLYVIDGDTVKVRLKGQTESVRMLRINTPERNQPGFTEATRALRSMVEGRDVMLEFESGRAERDRYGRILAYIIVGGVNANVEMVRQGWSRYWTKFGPGRLASEFEAAEHEARRSAAGLWSDRGWRH